MDILTRGIDVSEYQGNIDWAKVKASGKVDFAILRCGIRGRADSAFEDNYKGATAAGVPVGAYYYTAALDVAQAKQDAELVIKLLRGKRFDYPIYYDFEWTGDKKGVLGGQFKLTKVQSTAVITAFCATLEAAGCWVGVYASDSWFYSHIDAAVQKRYAVWSAKVADAVGNPSTYPPVYGKTYKLWQYSWVGKIPGISVNVDTNYCYMDYPAAIKAKGLNGYGKAPEKTYCGAVSGIRQNDVEAVRAALKRLGYTIFLTED
jgi:lysozyme